MGALTEIFKNILHEEIDIKPQSAKKVRNFGGSEDKENHLCKVSQLEEQNKAMALEIEALKSELL